jgi:hypothetical protein
VPRRGQDSGADTAEVGHQKELDAAIRALREIHKRGVVVVPNGDHGFAWTPHGTYAREMAHFITLLKFTPIEALIAARGVWQSFSCGLMSSIKLKRVIMVTCILADGNPIKNIEVFQNHDKLSVIVINGRVHKAGQKAYVGPPLFGQDDNRPVIVPDFPDVNMQMQKNYQVVI